MTENMNEAGGAVREPGWERDVLERLAFATLTEQRRARRWGIFFKLFFAAYLLFMLFLLIGDNVGGRALAARYTALVELDGEISADSLASADNVITGLRSAFEDKGTAGVILRANSPGGSPVQAGYIYDEIKRLRAKYPKIPVYGVVTDMCASGCYYALAAADKIYADRASIVGSIGVLMNSFGFVEGMKKLGIERRLLTAGEHKAMLDPFSPLKPFDRKHAQQLLERVHQQFIERVRSGRGQALKETRTIYSGLFWTGEEALKLGLVDEFGSAGFVAREVVGAEDIVDFSYQEALFDRFARRIGTAMARVLGTEVLGRPGLR
ncbi:peptidase S49 [Sulfurifustis variabilis]|uniref:Peptidase S49 n=1 Tax=Sulfurifustis variabilis TaxID=1675686 RepID=A0A1B4VBW2_9GAMM|nr:S49 family peptidase [Sulfurifustis variabilis]BAU48441.1 peptidase S49 [Sulfurifustis variabilis]